MHRESRQTGVCRLKLMGLQENSTPLNELIDLSGKGAIITSGASGIISYRLAEAGARVIIADADREIARQASLVAADGG
jgi:hypothetical protein